MIIAAVSGGMDSVGLLWHLLGGDEPVHVHHVSFRTVRTQRGQAEDSAMENIIPWMLEHRGHFTYSESVHRPGIDPGGCDVKIVSRHIGQYCKANKIRPIAYCRGGTFNDTLSPGIGKRRASALREWRRWWPAGKAPPIRFPLAKMHRAEIWNMLPEELREMTTSCRSPQIDGDVWRACGECHACKSIKSERIPWEREIAV